MKVVINRCFGGFGLSMAAYEAPGIEWDGYGYDFNDDSKRSDPDLVRVVEQLGERANGKCANLRVVEIPDGIDFTISGYDGMERVEEVHRSWY